LKFLYLELKSLYIELKFLYLELKSLYIELKFLYLELKSLYIELKFLYLELIVFIYNLNAQEQLLSSQNLEKQDGTSKNKLC